MEDLTVYQKFLNEMSELKLSSQTQKVIKIIQADIQYRMSHPTYRQWSSPEGGVGKRLYEAHLRQEGVHLTVEELISLATSDFIRIESEMNRLARQIDPASKNWLQVYRKLRTNCPPEDKVVDAYQEKYRKVENFVKQHDLISVPAPIGITRTPPNKISFFPIAGIFNFKYPAEVRMLIITPTVSGHLDEIGEHNEYIQHPILIHEVCGHHYQITGFEKGWAFMGYPLPDGLNMPGNSEFFFEGWAMYWEKLMLDKGYYHDNPEAKLAALRLLLFRAARAFTSVKLETGQMSREGAIDLMIQKLGFSPKTAEAEVDARHYKKASYYLGLLQMLQLRKHLEKQAGFVEKDFHDRLISGPRFSVPDLAKLNFQTELPPLTADIVRSLDILGPI